MKKFYLFFSVVIVACSILFAGCLCGDPIGSSDEELKADGGRQVDAGESHKEMLVEAKPEAKPEVEKEYKPETTFEKGKEEQGKEKEFVTESSSEESTTEKAPGFCAFNADCLKTHSKNHFCIDGQQQNRCVMEATKWECASSYDCMHILYPKTKDFCFWGKCESHHHKVPKRYFPCTKSSCGKGGSCNLYTGKCELVSGWSGTSLSYLGSPAAFQISPNLPNKFYLLVLVENSSDFKFIKKSASTFGNHFDEDSWVLGFRLIDQKSGEFIDTSKWGLSNVTHRHFKDWGVWLTWSERLAVIPYPACKTNKDCQWKNNAEYCSDSGSCYRRSIKYDCSGTFCNGWVNCLKGTCKDSRTYYSPDGTENTCEYYSEKVQNGKCVKMPCSSNGECRKYAACIQGYCGNCKINSDCENGEICRRGYMDRDMVCAYKRFKCTVDSDCGENRCVLKREPDPGWKGLFVEPGTCVYKKTSSTCQIIQSQIYHIIMTLPQSISRNAVVLPIDPVNRIVYEQIKVHMSGYVDIYKPCFKMIDGQTGEWWDTKAAKCGLSSLTYKKDTDYGIIICKNEKQTIPLAP